MAGLHIAGSEVDQLNVAVPLPKTPPLTPVAVNPVTWQGARKLSAAEEVIPIFLFAIFISYF